MASDRPRRAKAPKSASPKTGKNQTSAEPLGFRFKEGLSGDWAPSVKTDKNQDRQGVSPIESETPAAPKKAKRGNPDRIPRTSYQDRPKKASNRTRRKSGQAPPAERVEPALPPDPLLAPLTVEERVPQVVLRNLHELLPFGPTHDDYYRGVRTATSYGGPTYGWYVVGKPLRPEIVPVRCVEDARALTARLIGAKVFPSPHVRQRSFYEGIAYLTESGASIIFRIPSGLVPELPDNVRVQLIPQARNQRFVRKDASEAHYNDWAERYTGYVTPPQQPMSPFERFAKRFTQPRNVDQWLYDKNAPEWQQMKWELTVLDVWRDLGPRAALRVLHRLINDYGWARILHEGLPFTLNDLRDQLVHDMLRSVMRVHPPLRGGSNTLAKRLESLSKMFANAQKVVENASR
jgi:hypothetical protein